MEEIYNRFKEVRLKLGLSQDEFAKNLGFTRGVITNIEFGRTTLRPLFIEQFCKTYHVNEVWLRTGEGEMFTTQTNLDELTAFFTDALQEDDDFRRRFLLALSRMPPEGWSILRQMVEDMAQEQKTEGQTD